MCGFALKECECVDHTIDRIESEFRNIREEDEPFVS
jgi:hypothetical protein